MSPKKFNMLYYYYYIGFKIGLTWPILSNISDTLKYKERLNSLTTWLRKKDLTVTDWLLRALRLGP